MMIFVLLTLFFILMISDRTSKEAFASSKEEREQHEIRRVVFRYFENQQKSIIEKQAEDNRDIVCDPEFQEMCLVQNMIKAEGYKRFNQRVKDYRINIKYSDVEFLGNRCIAALNKGVVLISENAPNIIQQAKGEKHLMMLIKQKGRWSILKDIYTFGINPDKAMLYDKKYIGNKTKALIAAFNDLYKMERQYKESLFNGRSEENSTEEPFRAVYDGYKARLYAYNNWDKEPPQEIKDNDCTDFVSNCIHAGGIPASQMWKPFTNAWIRVEAFRNYMVQNKIAKEYTSSKNIQIGDVVQLQHKAIPQSAGIWGHTVLVTYIDSANEMYIACHSEPRYNYPLSNYLIDALWQNPFGDFRYEKFTE